MSQPAHFEGKDALGHVVEVQARGKIASQEIHGTETPGHISAAADAARDTGAVYLLLTLIFFSIALSSEQSFFCLSLFTIGWLVWRMGRSAWLGWMRLERLHRLVAEEKWEIEHHRQQERDELRVLYRAKGFEGKLLEDVLDVLMSDKDRLLRVMLEEELGLTLEKQEHPLKEGLGAATGVLLVFILSSFGHWIVPFYGIIASSLVSIGIAGWLSAHYEKNRRIAAAIWTSGLAVATLLVTYFLFHFFTR